MRYASRSRGVFDRSFPFVEAVPGADGGAAYARGRAVVREALRQCRGNRSQAARLLGLSRPTLLARMEKYGLKIETRISDE